ncbi:MAG: hypothetical protein AVDCRST_MAG88-1178, partial [uncultured Thermomicrobiales bacterium]
AGRGPVTVSREVGPGSGREGRAPTLGRHACGQQDPDAHPADGL